MAKTYTDLHELARQLRACQRDGRRVVLANGCFDVIHGGHVSYLEDARACGDVLVVGLNSDRSVRRLKGPSRPVCNEGERLTVLEALRCVDYIIVFEEDTCENLLRVLRPDVHAKGTDYTAEGVPERAISDELGIRTVITGNPKENATKTMIRKIAGDEIPVVRILGTELPGKSIKELRESAWNYARERGIIGKEFLNKETGWHIHVNVKSLQHGFSNHGPEQIWTVPALPELLRVARRIATEPHVPLTPDIRCVHRFVAPLEVRGELFCVKLTVKEHLDAMRLYDHEAAKMKRPGGNSPEPHPKGKLGFGPAPSLSHISIKDLLSGVKGKERSQPESGLDVPSITGYERGKPAVMPERMAPASPAPDSGTAGSNASTLRRKDVEVKARESSHTQSDPSP